MSYQTITLVRWRESEGCELILGATESSMMIMNGADLDWVDPIGDPVELPQEMSRKELCKWLAEEEPNEVVDRLPSEDWNRIQEDAAKQRISGL